MKISKQSRRSAKRLLQTCKVNGYLDEDLARKAVTSVISLKPRGYLAILTHLQRLIRLEVERMTARVQSAVPLSAALQSSIAGNLTRLHGPGLQLEFATNPDLLGGLRIKVGSTVYDDSVRARLDSLEESLSH